MQLNQHSRKPVLPPIYDAHARLPRTLRRTCAKVLLLAASLACGAPASAQTAFTYQGQLKQSGSPATGDFNMDFVLFDAAVGGMQIGPALPFDGTFGNPPPVSVTNGLFTVALDFGPSAFSGARRWLEIYVNSTQLLPRQEITPAPYAMYALKPWETNGNHLSYTAGNVGIGINGGAGNRLLLNGALDVDTAELRSDRGPNYSYIHTEVTGDWVIRSAASSGKVLIQDGTGGKVGIGTSTPAAKLDVVGNAFGSSTAIAASGPASGIGIDATGGLIGVYAHGGTFAAVDAVSTNGTGVLGSSTNGDGVRGATQNDFKAGVSGSNSATGIGVLGTSTAGFGVRGENSSDATYAGVIGVSTASAGNGVIGEANTGTSAYGVWGRSTQGIGGVFEGGNLALWANGRAKVQVLEITGGADLAEPFDVAGDDVQPGMVVVIDSASAGRLTPCDKPYDRKVAGVISGAGGVGTGLSMSHEGTIADGKHPVALSGRVYCLTDATTAPIEPGDVLTTSARPGHAMKASDFDHAHGAIIGKAMTSLTSGTGLVLVLVNLQ